MSTKGKSEQPGDSVQSTGRPVGRLTDDTRSDWTGAGADTAPENGDPGELSVSSDDTEPVDGNGDSSEANLDFEDVDLQAELEAASDGALLGVEMTEQAFQPESDAGPNGDTAQDSGQKDELEASEAMAAVSEMLGEPHETDTTDDAPSPDPSEYIAKMVASLSHAELTIGGLRDEIVQMNRISQELTDELQAVKDKLMQSMADRLSFRQRADREKEETVQYANERLLRELLPSLDSYERAIEHSDPSSSDPFVSGVRMVRQQMIQALQRFNLESFRSQGELFDPARHEACAEVESDEHYPGTVVNVVKTGYLLSGRLLRPALVTVCKAAKVAESKPVESVDDETAAEEVEAISDEGANVEIQAPAEEDMASELAVDDAAVSDEVDSDEKQDD